ncbi:ATP-binding protein [uncultured Phascolarctobacterium sp.]|uniref:ATP-binding protein n=1 Tax=uncultured Phascolarctobacterium sp. TaxID=512296 RepID=UPI0025FB3E00|nr:ATP-binding protein [uncultured Phascolarctobacterium sp.]
MKQISRPEYLGRLQALQDTPDIKIITGVRRSGKSILMREYISYLQQQNSNCNIIYVDFMDLAFEDLKEYHALYTYIENAYQEGRCNYVFIDEVQLCPHFELAVNSLHSKQKYDLYLTGSNAFLLSADLATLFTGRYIEIHVFPFSFAEYCSYFDARKDVDALFDDYVLAGGLAGSYAYKTNFDKSVYIREVYQKIMHRDLRQKYKPSDETLLDMVSEFLMDNISNITSSNKIAATLTSNKLAVNHVTIGKYLKYLCTAFLFYKARRYDIRGKKYLESSAKYYLVDSGMRFAVLGSRNLDYGRVYENIVYLELLRRGYDVYVGKLYNKEVDFVAKQGSELLYIQVSDDISRSETMERECDSLLKIKDAYPKIILARTKHEAYTYNGIIVYDIARWLVNKKTPFKK